MRRILLGSAVLASLVAVAIRRPSEKAPRATVVEAPASPVERPPAVSWDGVDLDDVRAALPDNRYWTLGAPTTDPAVQAERHQVAEDRNRMLGKVLSGNATEAEIAAHYDEIQRVNEDYAAFSRYVLQRYRAVLTERDAGLLELALAMNEQRLAQLPDERLRAVVRKREQDRARAAWNSGPSSEIPFPGASPGNLQPTGGAP